ncbi:ribose-phosphate diphosphokinase, variant [Allomyces macrogynus ATCC 38327]|nr:ribose-phosphate diphosphokinase, variant [Allomyces macrogynus ATCC 38327]|eukprot:KNE70449.1 ribose-phosphate diphosphokinase, variant [Allomyces macrogynus ATCC 38327]
MRDLVVLGGSSHPELTRAICERLAISPGHVKLTKFSNRETNVEVIESVRGMDVYIVQSGCGSVNDNLMELLIMISACKIASARKITAVLPLFPYSRQPDGPYKRNGMPLNRLSDEACQKLADMQGMPFPHVTSQPASRSPSPTKMLEHPERYNSVYDGEAKVGAPTPVSGVARLQKIQADHQIVRSPRSTSPVSAYGGSVNGGQGKAGAQYKLWTAKPGTLIADMLVAAGAHHIITMDMHHPQFQGFFDIPVDNLNSYPLMYKYIVEKIPDWKNAVIVSPDAGGAKRATAIADALNMNFALIHKDRRHATSTLTLVGNVKDRVVIMIDDIADTCHTLARAAHVLTRNGAAKVYALVTHGIMSGDAIDRLVRSPIDTLIVSNTVPQVEHVKAAATACGRADKIKVFDVAPILAEAVRRIHNGESVSFLFDIVPIVN